MSQSISITIPVPQGPEVDAPDSILRAAAALASPRSARIGDVCAVSRPLLDPLSARGSEGEAPRVWVRTEIGIEPMPFGALEDPFAHPDAAMAIAILRDWDDAVDVVVAAHEADTNRHRDCDFDVVLIGGPAPSLAVVPTDPEPAIEAEDGEDPSEEYAEEAANFITPLPIRGASHHGAVEAVPAASAFATLAWQAMIADLVRTGFVTEESAIHALADAILEVRR